MTMLPRLTSLLGNGSMVLGSDGIFSAPLPASSLEQRNELVFRETVAARQSDDYMTAIAGSHSIPVMDYEVDRFLSKMPKGALILDIGGCWGWHWRRLATTRPDVGVVILDFARPNLVHALRMLGPLVGVQVALVHADATALPFLDPDEGGDGFDGVWTVQVLQHIPDFEFACREARRVLKRGGQFANYSAHATPLNRLIYTIAGRHYHTDGVLDGALHLTRANDKQRQIVSDVFGATATDRYTECLFHPELRFTFAGRPGSLLGKLDARLGEIPWLGRWIARQRGFEVTRP